MFNIQKPPHLNLNIGTNTREMVDWNINKEIEMKNQVKKELRKHV
jgi:hypothetical protein